MKPCIYKIHEKEKYMPLLLLADEQKDMIDRYLNDAEMYVVDDCGVKGEVVVSDVGNGIIEIKNMAVFPQYRRHGYGRLLIDYICEKYKNDFSSVQVGTGDSPLTIPFYEKCGFVKSHVVKDFFKDNYDHIIVEAGITLVDMIYLKKDLQRRMMV